MTAEETFLLRESDLVPLQAVHGLQAGLPSLLLRLQPTERHGLLQVWIRRQRPPPAHVHHGRGQSPPQHGLHRRPVLVRTSQQEAEEREDNLHQGPAGRAGVFVPEDEVSGHLYAGGGRSQNKFTRISCAGW